MVYGRRVPCNRPARDDLNDLDKRERLSATPTGNAPDTAHPAFERPVVSFRTDIAGFLQPGSGSGTGIGRTGRRKPGCDRIFV
ncbi:MULTISPECIES: hypothetical protein [Burkholderia]|uniref:hypothetical protein n=1 Tax=Burkholderia TaxID=32008 RepID=UPI00126A47EC|nr:MULTISPECIES: hypothetical protein [Burkholderia]